jgi:hypothetical protein
MVQGPYAHLVLHEDTFTVVLDKLNVIIDGIIVSSGTLVLL